MSIGELCNREVVVAERSLSVTEMARLMRQYHVGDVVVDKAGWLLGIVTLDDLMEPLAEEIGEMARLVSTERHRETITRRQAA